MHESDFLADFSDCFDVSELDNEERSDLSGVLYEKPTGYIDAFLAKNPDDFDAEELANRTVTGRVIFSSSDRVSRVIDSRRHCA